MTLEGRETSNGFALELERRHAVGDALLCVRDDRSDRVPQLGERCSLGLLESAEVLVDLCFGHGAFSRPPARTSREPEPALAHIDAATWQLPMRVPAGRLCGPGRSAT